MDALLDRSCDRACLIGHLKAYMAALGAGDAARLPLASDVVYTENNVPIGLDEGLWGTVDAVDAVGLETADPTTGNARRNFTPALVRKEVETCGRCHARRGAFSEDWVPGR